MILTTAAMCLALNVYHEARGESLTGQHAVAQVTMNRAERDPNRVCSEVFKPKQFSWANTLTSVTGKERERRARKFVPRDEKAWALAKSVAQVTIAGVTSDFTKGATQYHANYVHPFWTHEFKLVAIIGHHRFYA